MLMKLCEKNIGFGDRVVRLTFAVAFAVVGYMAILPPWNYVAYFIALVLLLTSVTQSCCLYSLIGANTLDKPAKQSSASPKRRKR
jgi:hypothetical protein